MACRFPLKFNDLWTLRTSHLISKAQRLSADDRQGIDLTDWTFLLVGTVESCSLTLWPPCPKDNRVICHFVRIHVLFLNSRMWASSPTSCWTGWRTPSRWRLKKTGDTALYVQRSLLKEWAYSRQMLVGVVTQHILKQSQMDFVYMELNQRCLLWTTLACVEHHLFLCFQGGREAKEPHGGAFLRSLPCCGCPGRWD